MHDSQGQNEPASEVGSVVLVKHDEWEPGPDNDFVSDVVETHGGTGSGVLESVQCPGERS